MSDLGALFKDAASDTVAGGQKAGKAIARHYEHVGGGLKQAGENYRRVESDTEQSFKSISTNSAADAVAPGEPSKIAKILGGHADDAPAPSLKRPAPDDGFDEGGPAAKRLRLSEDDPENMAESSPEPGLESGMFESDPESELGLPTHDAGYDADGEDGFDEPGPDGPDGKMIIEDGATVDEHSTVEAGKGGKGGPPSSRGGNQGAPGGGGGDAFIKAGTHLKNSHVKGGDGGDGGTDPKASGGAGGTVEAQDTTINNSTLKGGDGGRGGDDSGAAGGGGGHLRAQGVDIDNSTIRTGGGGMGAGGGGGRGGDFTLNKKEYSPSAEANPPHAQPPSSTGRPSWQADATTGSGGDGGKSGAAVTYHADGTSSPDGNPNVSTGAGGQGGSAGSLNITRGPNDHTSFEAGVGTGDGGDGGAAGGVHRSTASGPHAEEPTQVTGTVRTLDGGHGGNSGNVNITTSSDADAPVDDTKFTGPVTSGAGGHGGGSGRVIIKPSGGDAMVLPQSAHVISGRGGSGGSSGDVDIDTGLNEGVPMTVGPLITGRGADGGTAGSVILTDEIWPVDGDGDEIMAEPDS